MMSLIRFRYDIREPLAPEPTYRVKLCMKLVGTWPSITAGGCRWTIQDRDWFMVQIRILTSLKFKWEDGILLPEVNN